MTKMRPGDYDVRTRPRRVLLLLSSLHGGGAERVAARLAGMSDGVHLDVRIGLLRRAGPFLAEVDPARVTAPGGGDRWFTFEGANTGFYRPDKLLAGAVLAPLAFRRMIRAFEPDVVMSFLKGTTLIADLAMRGLGRRQPRWIVREGNNTLAVIGEELARPATRRLIGWYVRRRYAAADVILVNSQHMADGLAAELRIDRRRFQVIHNPIDAERVQRLATAPIARTSRRPYIVTVGRLEFQKAHDVLLAAYARSRARDTHDLVIVGRGSLRATLERQAAALGVADRVAFTGFEMNPWAWVARADLFALPSRWEGFPTALGEAQACGVPVVATDCRFGPRELIAHGDTGWLTPVDDVAALREAIDKLIAERALAGRLAAAGQAAVARFAPATILARYAALFASDGVAPAR